ncbi:MAG: hypothetical protein AAF394_15100 [Planctomycetota bacterium]
MNRLFLILGAIVLAAFSFLLGLCLQPQAEPEIVYVEQAPRLVVERNLGFSCDYEVGDLIPCEAAKAEFELAVSVFVGEEQVHSWNVPFAIFDGTNNDTSTDFELRSGYFCALRRIFWDSEYRRVESRFCKSGDRLALFDQPQVVRLRVSNYLCAGHQRHT